MIITISGLPGSGKSTVGQILSKKLKLKYYDIGLVRRSMAKVRGMTLAEFNKLGEKESFTDFEVDDYQKKLGKEKDGFILVSRLGYHFVPNSKKIFLTVDINEAAKRISNDPSRVEHEHYKSLKEAVEKIKERNESDKTRYQKYYSLDPNKKANYDFVIDTSKKTPYEVVELILKKMDK